MPPADNIWNDALQQQKHSFQNSRDDYSDMPDYEPEEGEYTFPQAATAAPSFSDLNSAAFNMNSLGGLSNNSTASPTNRPDLLRTSQVKPSSSFSSAATSPGTLTPADFGMPKQSTTSGVLNGNAANGQDNGLTKTSITAIAQNKLDSRAAELKQQLLLKRLGSNKDAATAAQRKEKSPSGSARPFVPHVAPRSIQEVRQPSFTADDSDIAELIAGIAQEAEASKDSGETAPIHDDVTMEDVAPSVDADKAAGRILSKKQENQQAISYPHTANNEARLRIESSSKYYSSTSKPSANAPERVPAPSKPDSPANPSMGRMLRHAPSREEGEISSSQATPTEAYQPKHGVKAELQRQEFPGRTSERPRYDRNDKVGVPKSDSKKPPTKGINPNDQDLKDWLVFTNWYDVEYRASVLSRRRRLVMIEEERKQLLAEEEAMNPFTRQQSAPDPTTSSLQTSHGEPQGAPPAVPVQGPTPTKSEVSAHHPATPSHGLKRGYDTQQGDEKGYSGEKRPRVNDHQQQSSEYQGRDRRPYESHKYTDSSDHSYGRRPSSSRKWSPTRGNHHDYNRRDSREDRYYDRGGYSRDYKDSRDRRHSRSHSPARRDEYEPRGRAQGSGRPSRVLDLGHKGDTRFFMVKSFNEANVQHCKEDGYWTTQLTNGEILTEAFGQCKNVILIFSINKSKAFQGYARMATVPSPHLDRPPWMKSIHWKTTDPFRVEWYNEETTEFRYVHHLQNALLINPDSRDQSVIVGKDGQEIEEECARELLRLMDKTAEFARHGPRSAGYGGYHDFEKRDGFVKREGP